MTLFVSYTKSDDAVVRTIRADLEQLGHDVWMDHQIHGGESWWREIIREIQGARVFVFALSNSSWKSKPCRLELDYANDLGIPVLPLQVGPLDHMYIPLAEKQIIDFRERSADGVVKLVTALTELVDRPVTLPDPLPEPPPVPFEYLYRIASVMGPNRITPERQEELIGTLRRKLREEDDLLARGDIVKLLHELKDRNEITVPNARDIDEILAGVTPGPSPEDGATRLPPADHWRKVPLPTPPSSTTDGARSAPEPTGSPTVAAGGPATGAAPGSAAGPTSESAADSGARAAPGLASGPSGGTAAGPESGVAGRSWPVPGSGATGGAAPVSGGTGAESGAETGSASAGGVRPGAQGGIRPVAGEPSEVQPKGGAPEWLADLVRIEPVRPPSQPVRTEPETGAPQVPGWWTRQNPVPHVEPQQVRLADAEQGRRFGWLGIGLGVVGVLFLVVAMVAGESARVSLLAIVALLVGVLGMSVGVVSIARQEPGARVAAVVAAVGLVGAIGYAMATWI